MILASQENSLQTQCFKFGSRFSEFDSWSLLLWLARIVTEVLTDGLVQNDSCPVSGGELGLADISDCAWLRAADPYSVPDFKAVCVLG